jgi:hypothetical protein
MEPMHKRFISSAGAREIPGYKFEIIKINKKPGRNGQYVRNDLKLIWPGKIK